MKHLTLFISTLLLSATSFAQLSITSTNSDYIINFDETVEGINNGIFQGTGFTSNPADGQLDSDGITANGLTDGTLEFGGTQSDNDFARGTSTGKIGGGGLYAFDIDSTENNEDYAIGVQPTGIDFTPGTILVKITNNTQKTISALSVTFDIFVFNNENRSNSFNFSYSTDNTSYVEVNELNYTSPEDADGAPTWDKHDKNTTISASIDNGSSIYLKWTSDDVSGSNSRDEFALDNITISATTATSINTKFASTISFYPNPFTSQLTAIGNTVTSVEILNTIGQLVKKEVANNTNKIVISTSNLANGIYIVKATDNNGNLTTEKVIKQ